MHRAPPPSQLVAAAILTAALTPLAAAIAQPLSRSDRLQAWELRRIRPNLGDVGGLSVDSQLGARETRLPDDFANIYEIPIGSGTRYDGWFVRVSGATYAVFPRSEYSTLPDGKRLARVPANTTFFLGGIPKDLDFRGPVSVPTARVGQLPLPLEPDGPIAAPRVNAVPVQAGSPIVVERIDSTHSARLDSSHDSTPAPGRAPLKPDAPAAASAFQAAASAAAAREAGQRMMDDETYRARRVEQLLDRAARPAAAPTTPATR